VRLLAITDSARSPLAPDLPTLGELGMDAQVAGAFIGLVAPAGVPEAIITVLRDAYVKTMQSPDVKERLEQIGSVVPDTTTAALEEVIERDMVRAQNVAAKLNVKTER
jgi:tripartite-type tricarboxylate transporter receptor subunit TctC